MPAVHRSPLLLKIMKMAASSARSMSASSKTTNGLLPPSSMLNFLSPAALHDPVAGRGRPGERDRGTSGCAAQRLACLLAVAVDDVQHAGRDAGLERELAEQRCGHRRQLAHLQHRRVAEGEAGATFQVAVMNGTFQGLIRAQTPTGWNSV